jgi:hypothetical protein
MAEPVPGESVPADLPGGPEVAPGAGPVQERRVAPPRASEAYGTAREAAERAAGPRGG